MLSLVSVTYMSHKRDTFRFVNVITVYHRPFSGTWGEFTVSVWGGHLFTSLSYFTAFVMTMGYARMMCDVITVTDRHC